MPHSTASDLPLPEVVVGFYRPVSEIAMPVQTTWIGAMKCVDSRRSCTAFGHPS